jgi:hypothetical protein
MNKRLAAAGLVAAAVIGAGGWYGYRALNDGPSPAAVQAVPDEPSDGAADAGEPTGDVETVDAQAPQAVDQGATPMAERVGVLGLLNKRNGVSRDLTLKPGQAVRVGDTIVRLRACERTAPWEAEQLTGAFVQFDVQGTDAKWRRAFSGWLYKERPGLNVVQHPVYDVWTKSCTMSFPDKGADTVVLESPGPAAGGGGEAPRRSRAKNSPAPAPETPSEPSAPASADDSRET